MKKIIGGLILVLIILGFAGFWLYKKQTTASIDSYDKCVDAGFPVMESYPPRCSVPGGGSFTQYIGNELELNDEIVVTNPRPNQKITSPLKVEGKARGMWFFEGSFSGDLFDENDKKIGSVILTATKDWMSDDFVPFEGNLTFEKPVTSIGELIIKNANPSGLSENEKNLIIPVKF